MNKTDAKDMIIKEIIINARVERVFEALINPEQRVTWWGVEGRFQVTHMESDLRLGGAWLMSGIGVGGKPFSVRGEYRSIERPRLLEFTWLADWHDESIPSLVRFDLQEKGGVTTVRLTHSGLTSERSRENYKGWPGLLATLQKYAEQKVAASAK